MIIIQFIYWLIFMYGLLSLINDLITEFKVKKYNKDIKIYISIKNLEENLETLRKEIINLKWMYRNVKISVINDEDDFKIDDDILKLYNIEIIKKM